MAHAGRPWPTRYPHAAGFIAGQKRYKPVKPPKPGITPTEMMLAGVVIAGVLALHRVGVTHNDMHAHNLLLDERTGQPRWCDMDNAVVERDEDGDAVVHDSLPPDGRIYTALLDSALHVFLYGTWLRDRATHIARDWAWIRDLLRATWPPDSASPDRRWANALAALNAGNDQAARLAWTILRSPPPKPPPGPPATTPSSKPPPIRSSKPSPSRFHDPV
jgi:hypothetical protein